MMAVHSAHPLTQIHATLVHSGSSAFDTVQRHAGYSALRASHLRFRLVGLRVSSDCSEGCGHQPDSPAFPLLPPVPLLPKNEVELHCRPATACVTFKSSATSFHLDDTLNIQGSPPSVRRCFAPALSEAEGSLSMTAYTVLEKALPQPPRSRWQKGLCNSPAKCRQTDAVLETASGSQNGLYFLP